MIDASGFFISLVGPQSKQRRKTSA